MDGVDASQVVGGPPGLRLKFRNFNPRGLPMTTHDANSMAAAELADRYIETVLATKPDQLIGNASSYNSDVAGCAQRLAAFRLELINQLSQQPLPDTAGD